MADDYQYETLDIDHRDGVDWLTMNRPDQFNAINPKMTEEMLDYFGILYFKHEVRVVVLRGSGKHFCSGLDLNEAGQFGGSNPADMRGQVLCIAPFLEEGGKAFLEKRPARYNDE